jgi:hypothetical protein
MEVIPGSVKDNGNGAKPPKGNGSGPAAGERPRGAAKPEKDTKGRKDHGQEVNPDPTELMKGLKKLKDLREDKNAAASNYNKAKKALAKRAGFQADVVDAAVKAYAGEKEDLELQHRRAEQLSLAFESIALEQAKA